MSWILLQEHERLYSGDKLDNSQPETPDYTPKNHIPYKVLEKTLAAQASTLLPMWLPGGSWHGNEYVCSNIRGGGHSSSFRVFRSGDSWGWNDFAVVDQHGHGMINLYAAVRGITWKEAREELEKTHGELTPDQLAALPPLPAPPVVDHDPTVPPKHEWNFDGDPIWYLHDIRWAMEYGNLLGLPAPALNWTYRLETGEPWCVVARFNLEDGNKLPLPWYWSESARHWVPRRYAEDSLKIYNLDRLAKFADSTVIVGEGEKVAQKLTDLLDARKYTPTTFMGGVKAILRSDWTPLAGRKVILWPDADKPGREAMRELADHLIHEIGIYRLWIMDVDDMDDGWDAADAIDSGWSEDRVVQFINDRKNSGTGSPKAKVVRKIEPYEYEQISAILRKLRFRKLTKNQQWASLQALRQSLYPKRDAREWFQRDDFDAVWNEETDKRYGVDFLQDLLERQKKLTLTKQ